jgi:hypothetical protein
VPKDEFAKNPMGLFNANKSKIVYNAQGNPVNSYGKYESICDISRPGSTAHKAKRIARDFMIRSASAQKLAQKLEKSPSFIQNQGNLFALMMAKETAIQYIPTRQSQRQYSSIMQKIDSKEISPINHVKSITNLSQDKTITYEI